VGVKYTVRAIYKVEKELEIEVADGLDATDPKNWGEIDSEHDSDCYLHDVISAKPSQEAD
jgi:hypothetical protein